MAEWLEDGRPCSIMFKCSECGEKAYFVHGKARGRNKEKRYCGYNYCPWCGAKMTIIEADIPTESNAHPMCFQRISNADRIRAMSDEELATFLGFTLQDGYCYGAGLRKELKFIPVSEHNEMLEWLKKEVDE